MSSTAPLQDFESSVAFVFKAEGDFSNDAEDKGGPTQFGITQATYSSWLVNHGLHDALVAGITREYAEAIYHEIFWNAGGCDNLISPLNVIHFDGMVQHRPGAAKLLLTSARSFPTASVNQRCYGLLMLRDNLYRRIVLANPSQSKFLHGWLNRLENLRKYVGL